MADPNDLRVIKSRQNIRNALISLLSEKELSQITITELCERALINRKTFYRHYRSVSDVITEFENELLSDFSKILKNSNTSILDIGSVLEEISELIYTRQDYFRRLLKLNPELFSGGRAKAMLRRAFEISLRNVCEITDERTLHALSEYTVSGILSLYSDWFDGGCEGSLDYVADIARRITSNGLRAFVSEDKLKEIIS